MNRAAERYIMSADVKTWSSCSNERRDWAGLRIRLRDAGQRMAVNDSWIAATAMALEIPVVTQDDDYVDIPGLSVIHV